MASTATKMTPTLLIGLGGTGLAVLRKFKRLYLETNDEAKNAIQLLSVDTDDQPADRLDTPLDNAEFLNLAKPQAIDVANVVQQSANFAPLAWLRDMHLPAFNIQQGAGMKRLHGHIAYFWRGQTLYQRILEAVQPLVEGGANALPDAGSSVRVVIVSSLCGGTGTGMYLDVAYMSRFAIRGSGGGPNAKTFGFLFLPSAFQQLQGDPETWRAIHANGYAALQELKYYMDTPFAATDLYMPGRGEAPKAKLTDTPFDCCYLAGGIDESGQTVPKSDALYERCAEFLYLNVVTDVGSKLISVAVNGPKTLASFGSFSMPLPKARDLQIYFNRIGNEILDDVFKRDDLPAAAKQEGGDLQGLPSVIGMCQVERAEFVEALQFLQGTFANFPSEVAPANAPDEMSRELFEVKGRQQTFYTVLQSRADDLRREIDEHVKNIRRQEWTLDPGTIERTRSRLAAIGDSLDLYIASQKALANRSCPELGAALESNAGRRVLGVPVQKPSLANFREALSTIFVQQCKRKLASLYQTELSAIREEISSWSAELDRISKNQDVARDGFRADLKAKLERVAREESKAYLPDATLEAPGPDSAYAAERLGLLNRCRSTQGLALALVGPFDKPCLSTKPFTNELYKLVSDFIANRDSKIDLAPSDEFLNGVQKAKIQINLRQSYNQPKTLSWLFADPEDLANTLADQIKNAPGMQGPRPEVMKSLDGSNMMTFVRVRSSFAMTDLADIQFMAECYQLRKKGSEGRFLDLPTHRRADILPLGGADEGPRLFGLACLLGVAEEFGQNFLFENDPLLNADEGDPVARRKAAYAAVLGADRKARIFELRDRRIRALGQGMGNAAFVADMGAKLAIRYPAPSVAGTDSASLQLKAEKEAVRAYLDTLTPAAAAAGAAE